MSPLRKSIFLLFGLAFAAVTRPAHAAQSAADLGKTLHASTLDPEECYQIRDIEFSEEEAQYYLTSGYLIFTKPVNGSPLVAVFTAETEGGDAEVLLLPPDRSERRSLASYTGLPNLDEHFSNAIFLFTDADVRKVFDRVRTDPNARKSPEVGALLAETWNSVAKNVLSSFEARIVLDLMNPPAGPKGFFESLIQGKKLGNFDINYDPRAYEQIIAGQVITKNGASDWETWTSFTARGMRGLPPPEPEEKILSYKIDATLNSALELDCVTRIRIQATGASRNVIPFDFASQMTASEAKVDGNPAEVYETPSIRATGIANGNELLLVVPPEPLEPGSVHEVEIHHSGKVVIDAGHQIYFVSARGNWYPNRYAQFATYDVTYRYPKTLDLVSAGKVVEDRTEGDERITHRIPSGRMRLLAFNLGRYERRTVTRNGIDIEVCANNQIAEALRPRPIPPAETQPNTPDPLRRPTRTPPVMSGLSDTLPPPPPAITLSEVLAAMAGRVSAAMDFYTSKFGPPPLNQIEVSPVPGRFGQGFSGMIYLSVLAWLPPSIRPISTMAPYERLFYTEVMPAHEAAHQWWGNVVTAGSYHHEWIMEALSNYSALMFLEWRKVPKALDTALDEYRKEMLAKNTDGQTVESEGPVVQGRRLETSANPNAWNAVVYGKGTWIIHMIRRRMGDAQFLKMLAELRRRYEWQTVSTEEFRALCAEFMPPGSPDPELEDFFDVWVYGTGIPSLKLTYSLKGKPGAYRLTGTVTQSDVPDDFSVAVPVEIQTGRGKPTVKIVRTGSDAANFSVPVAIANAKAVLDPGQSVLRR